MTADYSGLADLIVSASKGYRASGSYRSWSGLRWKR